MLLDPLNTPSRRVRMPHHIHYLVIRWPAPKNDSLEEEASWMEPYVHTSKEIIASGRAQLVALVLEKKIVIFTSFAMYRALMATKGLKLTTDTEFTPGEPGDHFPCFEMTHSLEYFEERVSEQFELVRVEET